VVANKIRSEQDRDFLVSAMPDFDFLGFIPYDQRIIEAGLGNVPLSNASPEIISIVRDIAAHLGAVNPERIGEPLSKG
jgi:CO dehydrogenase maturation factor